jgi:L,D-transpeptidase YcbB
MDGLRNGRCFVPRIHRQILFSIALLVLIPTVSWALEDHFHLNGTDDVGALQREIQRRLSESTVCLPANLEAAVGLHQFYARRDFKAAWLDDAGLKPAALAFLAALQHAEEDGLNPEDYPFSAIEGQLAELLFQATVPNGTSSNQAAALDIRLSRTALAYGRHLAQGRIAPASTGKEWFGSQPKGAWQPRLDRMLTATTAKALTAAVAPSQPGYWGLRRALSRYRRLAAAGGWPTIQSEETLFKGKQSEAVAHLRIRLEKSGDITPEANRLAAATLTLYNFDTAVELGVSAFQRRHGLKPDGKVGQQTLTALNVSVHERLATLRANMERWRWVPADLGNRYLRVNIPAFELEAVNAGEVVKTMRVVVGRPKRPTPVLSGQMTYIELNPYWHIPPRIARKDILPHIHSDPDYLLQKGIRVFSDWTANAHELDPQTIDWTLVTERAFPYKLRQDPAASNALGQVKFMFPNEHSIYLHDTPAKGLFQKEKRSFSSGCVRVAQPQDLAALLLADQPAWDYARIGETFTSLEHKVVHLRQPMPVHLQYWTAWVDESGRVQFREDIYQRDRALLKALDRQHLRLVSCPPTTGADTIKAAARPMVEDNPASFLRAS